MSAAFLKMPMPALLTSTSSPPNRSTVGLHRALDLVGVARVGGRRQRLRAEARLRALEIRGVAAGDHRRGRRATTSASAMAKPMPFEPPVTSATLPSSAAPVGEAGSSQ